MTHLLRLTAAGVAAHGPVRDRTPDDRDGDHIDDISDVQQRGGAAGRDTGRRNRTSSTCPGNDRSIVRVSSRNGRQVFLTAFTYMVDRPRGVSPDQHVTLGEAPRGEPRTIQVWYSQGTRGNGRQFIYSR